MIAKLTSKNQLTLPKRIVAQFADAQYFEVSTEYGRIILEPMNTTSIMDVREKLEALGIAEADVADAVVWARKKK